MEIFMRNSIKLVALTALCIIGATHLYSQDYAFMYMVNKTATATVVDSTWYTVGSTSGNEFSAADSLLSSNWSFASNRLTAGSSATTKVYLVKFSLSFGASPATWQVGISKNGAEPLTILSRRTISSGNKDAGVVTGLGYVSLTATDYIELKVKQITDSPIEFDPMHAQVVLVEMSNSSTNYYGGMKIENNSAWQEVARDDYSIVTGFSINGQNNDWTVASDKLVAGNSASGTYLVSFSMSYRGDANEQSPMIYNIGITLNSGDPGAIITRRNTSKTDIGNINGCGILTINAGDSLYMEITADRAVQFTPYYSSISLYKISGTTTSARGHMDISSPKDQTISTASTWTTISGFSGGAALNDWTFSDNALNATSGTTSAGSYIVDYALSFQRALDTTDVSVTSAFSIFLDDIEQSELTIKRILSSSTDVGAAGGTGIINIASANTKVYLKIMNETNTENLTINSCTVNLHRIDEGSHDGSLPVELSSFSAEQDGDQIILQWETASEIENLGFILEKSVGNTQSWNVLTDYKNNDALKGYGSSTEMHEYQYIDKILQPGLKYSYRLSDVDYQGRITLHDPVTITFSTDNLMLLSDFGIHKAYPNPFNPSITLNYQLLQDGLSQLRVYNSRGQFIETLLNSYQSADNYSFVWHPTNISSGIYILRLTSGNQNHFQKIIYIK